MNDIEIGDTVRNDMGWQGVVVDRLKDRRGVEFLVQYASCREWEYQSQLEVIAKAKQDDRD